MQIVIDIPEKNYNSIKNGNDRPCFVRNSAIYAIKKGTILPKGHGRLIDADALIKQLEELANDEWNIQVGSSKGLEDAIDVIDDAPTIIEADKEE